MGIYHLAARKNESQRTVVDLPNHQIGSGLTLIAGACSVESEAQINTTAECVSQAGAHILRGGAFKPRTSPYSFAGLEVDGLKLLRDAADNHELPCVAEVMDARDIGVVAKYVDILQIGSRNMCNYSLLKAVGEQDKPVLLKRGLAATYEEFLLAAEHIMVAGQQQVILCERGIRTFEPLTRNTLDLAAVPMLHELSHLPVIVDPSHGTGRRSLIAPMSKAAIACGADGLMIEVHPNPDQALSDGAQSLDFEMFSSLAADILK